jgi:Mce-associated membrane protein
MTSRRADRAVVALAVVAVLAVLAAAGAGWLWWRASDEDGVRVAEERDEVLAAGSALLVTLNTLDHRNAVSDLDAWRAAATGQLLERFDRNRDLDLRNIQTQQTVATAGLLGAAVTEVDIEAGTASVIAALEVTVTRQGAEPARNRSRLDAGMTRTPDGWKVSSLEVVGQGSGP